MHRQNIGKIPVPDEFRTLLLEFTVTYLMEQPNDVVDFALDYFSRLKEIKTTQLVRPSSPDDSFSLEEGKYFTIVALNYFCGSSIFCER